MNVQVLGDPAGQGSWVAFSNRFVQKPCGACHRVHCVPMAKSTSSTKLSRWRVSIGKAFKAHLPEKLTGPVVVDITILLPRPKKSVHGYPVFDIDKLARSCLDALSGVAYEDDRQVVELRVRKEYCDPARAGAVISVEPWVAVSQLGLVTA